MCFSQYASSLKRFPHFSQTYLNDCLFLHDSKCLSTLDFFLCEYLHNEHCVGAVDNVATAFAASVTAAAADVVGSSVCVVGADAVAVTSKTANANSLSRALKK